MYMVHVLNHECATCNSVQPGVTMRATLPENRTEKEAILKLYRALPVIDVSTCLTGAIGNKAQRLFGTIYTYMNSLLRVAVHL